MIDYSRVKTFDALREAKDIEGLNDFFSVQKLPFHAKEGKRVPMFFENYDSSNCGYSVSPSAVRQAMGWVNFGR